jgi:hypothetical protein
MKPLRFRNCYHLLFMAVMPWIALAPVIVHPGWPYNHDGCAAVDRTYIYAAHFKQRDLIPIWSSNDGFGMGTPLPLFYHKLFYYPSGMLCALTGNMKASLVLTLYLFMVLGCYGVVMICRQMNVDRAVASVLSGGICFLNYTVTDWFVRGAVSEFSAAMLIPYLVAWCVRLIKTGKFSCSLGLIMLLLFLAHSVIALYAAVLILPAVGIALAVDHSVKQLKHILFRSLVSAAIFLALASIFLVPMVMTRAWYNISAVLEPDFLPWNNFKFFEWYFFNPTYLWQLDWQKMTVQMDLPVAVFLILSVFAFFRLGGRFNISREAYRLSFFPFSVLVFFVSAGIVCMALQLPCSTFFYKIVPGAKYVQFPWRLLSYVQVINYSLLLWMMVRLQVRNQGGTAMVLSAGLLLTLLSTYPLFVHVKYGWFPPSALESDRVAYSTFGLGEYMPKTNNLPEKPDDRYEVYRSLSAVGIVTMQGKADLVRKTPVVPEPMSVEYAVTCGQDSSVVRLPHSFSGLERIVTDDNGKQEKIRWYRTDRDPCIHVELPRGTYCLRVIFPRLLNLLYPRNVLPVKITRPTSPKEG